MKQLKFKKFISEKQAKDLIYMFAQLGECSTKQMKYMQTLNRKNIEKHLVNITRLPFKKIVEIARDYIQPLPAIENLAPASVHFCTDGNSKNEVSIMVMGEKQSSITDSGYLIMEPYKSCFEGAYVAFKESINDHESFITAISKGTESIEAYYNQKVNEHNKINSLNAIDLDDRSPFKERLKRNLPILLKKDNFNVTKEFNQWSLLFVYTDLRDEQSAHRKTSFSLSYKQVCKYLNDYKKGVVGFLIFLHQQFGDSR